MASSTPQADQLDEVVDYDFIRRSVLDRVQRGHIHLQETLADDLLKLMLAHPKVRAARVSTEKPDVYPDCEAVGVEVFGSEGRIAVNDMSGAAAARKGRLRSQQAQQAAAPPGSARPSSTST